MDSIFHERAVELANFARELDEDERMRMLEGGYDCAARSEGVTWFHQLSDKRTIITSHTPVYFYLHVHVHDHR